MAFAFFPYFHLTGHHECEILSGGLESEQHEWISLEELYEKPGT